VPLRQAPFCEGLRWASAAKLHFTLRFLGNVPDAEREGIARACAECAAELPGFALTLAGAGAFPRASRASVLWVGVEDGAAELCALAERLNERLAQRGVAREVRAFVPHLTIARAKRPLRLTAAVESLRSIRAQGWIEEIELVKSRLGGAEATHEVLERFVLGGPDRSPG
ncbi:MAG TPA: RNA 2',3'-cyclic phosphodiesterase, partial [Polyangiales bacterium]|nr:RNA 2',3'-cyclic phosphodiesterase [Polyangiales bacterium]